MDIKIIEAPLIINIYGFAGIIVNQNYGETGVALMDRMWRVVKGRQLKNKGINIWIYESGMRMMAGVELESKPPVDTGLENKVVSISKYAYWKHIGPYHQLKKVNADMRAELELRKIQYKHPCVEIYGHWNADETKLETEIIWAID